MSELKPCPFCGGEADLWSNEGRNGYFVRCECAVCGSKTKSFFMGPHLPLEWGKTLEAEMAREAWNRRINEKTEDL